MTTESTIPREESIALARQCLFMIRDIAERGAYSTDPEQVGYALQELSQVLLERTGTEERLFELASPELIPDLPDLHAELMFVYSLSESMAAPAYAGTWATAYVE